MQQLRAGKDRLLFVEEHRSVAEGLARLLPEVRRRGQEIVGERVRPLRIIVSATAPPFWRYCRVSDVPLFLFVAAVPIGMEVAWRAQLPRAVDLLCQTVGWLAVAVLGLTATVWALLARRLRAIWPNMAGVAIAYDRRLPPTIVVRWPRATPLPIAAALVFPTPEQECYLAYLLAHEYAHLLLRTRYRKTHLPMWWDEGFASWFGEQVKGVPHWRPESREHLSAPEPARGARRLFGQEDYVRLCARYYLEVRALAEQGRLPEVLRAPARRINSFRPAAARADQVTAR